MNAQIDPRPASNYPDAPGLSNGTRIKPFAAGSATGSGQSRRTRLVQRNVYDLGDANREFMSTGPNQDEVCMVVVPRSSACCFHFWLEVGLILRTVVGG
jgi:hypothetical protein